ncbi:MAG: isoaspartyl peptidase/L-asparaginase [Candidatus Hydrogenedentes bacterium]|nr:isoaspartyl peptidase/L-asparaginase [Candidatus Hydrogenedentota bacterium]
MPKHAGTATDLPVLVLHTGAGSGASPEALEARREVVEHVIDAVWPEIAAGMPAVDAVTETVALLEAEPSCNAGRGAILQSDGMARLSASCMDGARQKFSGVMLATHLTHPSRLARALQDRDESVLGPLGAQLLARELGIPPENPVTPERAERWVEYLRGHVGHYERGGTVGAVVLDTEGRIAAATSTGGAVISFPERVSDSATVAGNYASPFAGISCTGVGEQIVDDALAARIETRVRDWRSIIEASDQAYDEATALHRRYGWIGIDHQRNWVLYTTTEAMASGMRCGGVGRNSA